VRADQVVVITGNGGLPGPARTGYHVLRSPGPGDLDAAAWAVMSLMGEFRKPVHVLYDAETCAGGHAGHESCGACIRVCPYTAIRRNPEYPLRVTVDAHACEGCGACVAACPTSSLTFTDPTPGQLQRRIRALLDPVAGGPARPLLLAFHCPEQGAAALEAAGRGRWPYPASVLPLPMACLRHVSEADILAAFRFGAAGVALLGCEACPHGERGALQERLDLVRTVLEAFGLDGRRLELITGEARTIMDQVEDFAGALGPSPVVPDGGEGPVAGSHREAIALALRALMAGTGREPGPTPVAPGAPFATPLVRAEGCTLCRSCVNVCPTHAFRYQDDARTLELRRIACVNCGLCEAACPESVISFRSEVDLSRSALDYQVLVRDEPLRCSKCNTPFATRRAVETIEAKVLAMADLGETFAGVRRSLLRMCPNCRAVAAVLEMQKGWEP
jgi:ferredoxin